MSISPELALAAAAAIGDKALQEQTKELLQLKRQLAESRKVEITGSGGRPVYAKGQFEDGEYRDRDEGVDDAASTSSFYSSRSWWDVHLTMCDENVGLFLINLQHLEIRLGGIVYATTSNEVEGHDVIILDNNCSDGNNDRSPKRSRNVMIPIQSGGGCRNATIQIDLKDMPEPPWKMLKSAISYNQNQSEYVFGELIDVFDIMISSRQLPQRLPEQVAELVGISFDTSSVRSMLSCLRDDEIN
mmetsp:Transcript_12845/g.21768  ORF Transcript_12845/g.21768 Transcript_12845/m.21768 type:complete len:244 (-) Transcript_12845:242-973(-)